MARATYTIELELSYGIWTDVSADWLSAEPLSIRRGITPGEPVARVGRMTLALHSPDGRYAPGRPTAREGFNAGVRIRLRAAGGGADVTLFNGRVATVTPGQPRHDAVWLSCEDGMAALERSQVGAFPMLFDATPGELVERLITRAYVPPGRSSAWQIGHPVAARLGAGTLLSDAGTGVALDAGESVFPWAGDTWPPEISAAAALREIAASEGGTFAIAADGTPTFRGRHARPLRTTPDAVLDSALAGIAARRGGSRLASVVAVTVTPRAVGDPGEMLWEAGHAVRIGPGQVRTIVCPYRDPDELVAEVGALSVLTPRAGDDFTANERADGSGADRTGIVRLSVEVGARAAQITLWARPAQTRAVFVRGLALQGVPLRRSYPVTVTALDEAGLLAYGRRELALEMPLQDDSRVGDDMARALLATRSQPLPWLEVEVEATAGPGRMAQALARDVGDRLSVTDAALGLDAVGCFIDEVRHTIVRGGASHRVTWGTSPADLQAYFVLGTVSASLDEAARLGY